MVGVFVVSLVAFLGSVLKFTGSRLTRLHVWQMQQHAAKLQRAKEDAALKAMRRLLPDMSPTVWVLALEECNWDVEPAVILLNRFNAAKGKEISQMRKVWACVDAIPSYMIPHSILLQ